MSQFTDEREKFQILKNACLSRSEIATEYIRLIKGVFRQYNTSVYENRFVVGGAVETFTFYLLKAAGVQCEQDNWNHGIVLENKRRFEVSLLSTGISKVILHNKVEATHNKKWNTAKLFIVSNTGIIYGDPELVDLNHIVEKPGHVELQKQALDSLKKDPDNFIQLDIPGKTPLSNDLHFKTPGVAIASQIIEELKPELFLKEYVKINGPESQSGMQ